MEAVNADIINIVFSTVRTVSPLLCGSECRTLTREKMREMEAAKIHLPRAEELRIMADKEH
jgi:hypothetical protein